MFLRNNSLHSDCRTRSLLDYTCLLYYTLGLQLSYTLGSSAGEFSPLHRRRKKRKKHQRYEFAVHPIGFMMQLEGVVFNIRKEEETA